MQLTDIIVCPYLTEKTYAKRAEENKKYAFIVNIKANKNDIAMAFEAIFNISPLAIKTMIRKQVATKTGTIHPGYTKAFKIAYITLPKGKDIALSNEDLKTKQKMSKNAKPVANSNNQVNDNKVINIKEVANPSSVSSKKTNDIKEKHDLKKSEEASNKEIIDQKQVDKNH